MKQDAYKQYMAEVENWLHRGRRDLLRSVLERYAPSDAPSADQGSRRILEVGAGSGRNAEVLSAFGHVSAVEVEPTAVQTCEENPHIQKVYAKFVPFDLEANYDLICAMDFLEHVEDDRAVFDWMLEHLAENGIMFITVPAYPFLFSYHDVALQHFRRYTTGRLADLNQGRLRIAKRGYFNFTLLPAVVASRAIGALTARGPDKSKKQSSAVPGLVDRVLYRLLSAEVALIRRLPLFPCGLTAFIVLQRTGSDEVPSQGL